MIVTDTNMARVGIRKLELDQFGASTVCFMKDPMVSRQAKANGITRARVAVDMAVEDMKDGIYVIGNAPTALITVEYLVMADDHHLQAGKPKTLMDKPQGAIESLREIDVFGGEHLREPLPLRSSARSDG